MTRLPILFALAILALPATLFAQASPSLFTSGTRYDAVGHVTGTISTDPDAAGSGNPFIAVRNSYDGAGRLTRVETGTLSAWQSDTVAPASWTGFTIVRTLETSYDASSRKTVDSLREGAAGAIRTVTQYSYDSVGRLECTAVRMNPALFASLPASACTLGTAGSDGPDRITRNVYDAAGQRLQLREGVGTSVEGAEATWAYNANGQVTSVIDGNGNRAELHYDGYGRQDRWTFPSATRPASFNDSTQATALASAGSANANDYEAYTYDAAGNRTSLRKRDGSTIAYQYDALNRMVVKIVPERTTGSQALTAAQTRDLYYSYDLRNLQLSARFDSPSGEGVTNAWDGFGRLASSTSAMGGVSRTLTNQYDRNGNRTYIKHPDGTTFRTDYDWLDRPFWVGDRNMSQIEYFYYTAFGAPWMVAHGATRVISYDGVQRPSAVLDTFSSSTNAVNWTYGRNAAGQLSSVARDNDAFAWTGHFAVNRAYTTNGLNQYVAAGSASFAYDANGNLTGDGANSYVYDIENRLVSAGGARNATLSYDPLGRLWRVSSPTSGTTDFLYDGEALVAEYDGAGAPLRRYVHNAGADQPFAAYDASASGAVRFLFADHQGSIIATTDASGNVIAANSCDEYGIPGATNSGRFQYTGQAWLPEIGMYYYKARIYSPTLGRFLQTDPIGYDDQFNLYEYVGNDPINRADPPGTGDLCPTGCHGDPGDPGTAQRQLRAGQIMAIGAGLAVIAAAPEIALALMVRAPALTQITAAGAEMIAPGAGAATAAGALVAEGRAVGISGRAGRYEFPDLHSGNVPYVGQSGRISQRLAQHQRAGRMAPGTADTTPVSGGRTAREIAEHRRIQELTGGQPARSSPNVSNQRDPIGPRRRRLLDR